ncbi:MAG: phosphoribulokinase [Rhodospirillaceae bacterium]|nr:MAG: phosphoribulokinase [Rhodospirillaceae bacterium]
MLAIAGDSATGKTTVTAGLAAALGPDRCISISADDYHRFDRVERRDKPFTPLHPDCNYIDILEQHLQLLASGRPILKPVYNHSTGRCVRPERIEPNEFIIVHGLLPMYGKLARACFDISVFLDPPEEIRRAWKIQRDTGTRGYSSAQVMAEITAGEAESAEFIHPQRAHADIVVRFAPIPGRSDPPGTPLSAELLLRPTIRQPDLTEVLQPDVTRTIHLRLARDTDGRPVDNLHVHGYRTPEENAVAEKAIWETLGDPHTAAPACLGMVSSEQHSTPLAITQMILLHHLLYGPR